MPTCLSKLLLSPLPSQLPTNKHLLLTTSKPTSIPFPPLQITPPPPSLTATNPIGTGKEAGETVLGICYPSLAWANMYFFKAGFNAQVVPGEDEPEEVLIRKFRRAVAESGIIQECKTRRWFETNQEKRKRKTRMAALKIAQEKRRRRPYKPRSTERSKYEASSETPKEQEEEDNWELPEVELPYCK